MPAAPVIELGEVSRLASPGSQRQLPAGMLRTIVVTALTLGCLIGIGGAQRAQPSWTQPLWTAESSGVGSISLGTRNLYEIRGNREVVARDLHTGALRWTVDPEGEPVGAIDLGHGVAGVLVFGETRTAEVAVTPTLVLVDDATGMVLGSGDGDLIGVTRGGRVLLSSQQAPAGCEDTRFCVEVSSYDLRSGAQVWQEVITGDLIGNLSFTDDLDHFGVSGLDGTVALYDAESGNLTQRSPEGELSAESIRAFAGGRLLELAVNGSTAAITAYDRETLRAIWSRDLPHQPAPVPLRESAYLADCGRNLCVFLDDSTFLNTSTFIVDASTGQLRATVRLQVLATLGGGALMAWSPWRQSATADTGVYLLDPHGGRTLASFDDSLPISWLDSGGRALLVRQRGRRTGFILVNEWGVGRTLEALPVFSRLCQARAGVLACTVGVRGVAVWRLPL